MSVTLLLGGSRTRLLRVSLAGRWLAGISNDDDKFLAYFAGGAGSGCGQLRAAAKQVNKPASDSGAPACRGTLVLTSMLPRN